MDGTASRPAAMAEQPAGTAGEGARTEGPKDPSWEYRLRKYLLLLATLVATVTYGAAFNPPGGVWQEGDPSRDRIAGDPIIRETSYARYLVFFYSNATAFASSLVVIVLVLILSILHDRGGISLAPVLAILRLVMVLDLLSLMVAYAAGTFRDGLTAIYSLVLLASVVAYLAVHTLLASFPASDEQRMDRRAVAKVHKVLMLLASLTAPADKGKDGAPEKKMDKGEDESPEHAGESEAERADKSALLRLRKVLMLLATFAVSVTYVAGLSAPGGFWDNDGGGHRPGRAILKGGRHDARLKAFFVFNTTAFVASLLIIIILLDKKLAFSKNFRSVELYVFIAVTLIGLVGAYSAGSCRQIDTTIYVNSLVGAVIGFILVQAAIVKFCKDAITNSCLWKQLKRIRDKVSGCLCGTEQSCLEQSTQRQPNTGNSNGSAKQQVHQVLERARSLVLLLATLAAAITYQAGLNPPGGLWQRADAGGRYMAGDPILLTTNPKRYKAFYYCNSVAFVASLVAIVLVRMKTLHHHNALEAAMILDLLGLIGAYAAGSCRDVNTSIHAMALAGAVLVYVVIHLVLVDRKDGSTRGQDQASPENEEEEKAKQLEKRRKRLLLFAILAATITYQAGLTPPSGFLLKDDQATGHLAGDPVLLNNYPRRYTAFFYCNSVSFMLSIALIIVLVNPNLYRPAIRTNALSVCTAAGMMSIMGAYAAGSTQHLKTSIYIFALAAFVLFVVIVAVVFLVIHEKRDQRDKAKKKKDRKAEQASKERDNGAEKPSASLETDADLEKNLKPENDAEKPSTKETPKTEDEVLQKKLNAKRKYLMLLGILVASITYQAGLAPPGGVWQDDGAGHAAGDPVMHDNRRHRYLAFFYSNSTSFVASVVVIVLLLPPSLNKKWWSWWLGVMNTTIVLDLLGLLIAYAAGSSRSWKTAGYVSALVIAVLAYFVVHVAVSCFLRSKGGDSSGHSDRQNEGANGQSPARSN
ncbi:hypothetical protein SETIT_3G310900v2 [Setaria italica]|uniref:PGG domain-containing protein n=2 Tax=Setaria italica TaxID=4555 RepID=A0A368QKU6_SETIT|nr:uncharacterized protein LOC101764571 [Setaria italica]RCV18561.1 hypothetical protein SETIT_3G310900v2 [Setaria italica]